ncbi:hypothetical protein P3G55_02625 [Leptospira sp. 96542]|nr:hypothetical protein [Leptospira sp. 96542]
MRRICFIFVIFLLSCAKTSGKETYQFDKLLVVKTPERVSASIPKSFFPDSVTLVSSSELKTNFMNIKEAYVQLETKDSMALVINLVDSRANMGDWKLLEKTMRPSEVEFLLEGFLKKSLSIIVTDKLETREMRFYFKKQTTY